MRLLAIEANFKICASNSWPLGPIGPAKLIGRPDTGEQSRALLLFDSSGQGCGVSRGKIGRELSSDFAVHGQIAGQHGTTFAQGLDDRQVEPFGKRRGDEARRMAVTPVQFVIPHVLQPMQFSPELRMPADAFDQVVRIPAIFAHDQQPGVRPGCPQPFERVEQRAWFLREIMPTSRYVLRQFLQLARELASGLAMVARTMVPPAARKNHPVRLRRPV